ncbi:Outer membrane protein transport protein (OMPP1/FadL/TodX) [Novipirellula galeiformis]|uniref:Outer membrane protein transport protein (OMPP1/FadL/TodX) n=1 Tax=Novipirellula galeiformis TaxID=2528004 RepID=A0A5C6CAK7_9BACT|nr:outer membrane protein transport protein [Novipirellula galeiformis]TWU20424.1 Outer membrane protein transport protein (OMPP1/FadL/TodX) [Novipirellula galeiformis]
MMRLGTKRFWRAKTPPTGLLLTTWALAFLASPSYAAGTISNALSAREAGRGGTNLGFGDNGVLLLDNAAGMQGLVGDCDCNDVYIEMGGAGLFTDLSYADNENATTDAADNPTGLGYFMVARRLNEDIVLGFGAFAPAGFASDYDLNGPATLPGQYTYKSFGALARILPGISVRMTEAWTVGATLGTAISHVEIEGPYYLNSGPLRGTPTILDLQATGAALSWSCGTQYALSDRTTVGVHYQSENEFKSAGKAAVEIAGLGRSQYDVEFGLTWARSVGIGLMHQLDSRQRIGLDFEWEDWSSAYDNAELLFTQPSNPTFRTVAGPSIAEQFPLRWTDALIVSSGYERDLSDHQTVRLGYRYQDNPIPAATTSTYLQTTLQHHFSVGYGFKHRDWEIDTAYQFAFAPDVHTGVSMYPGGDYSHATVTTQTHMVFLSAIRRF